MKFFLIFFVLYSIISGCFGRIIAVITDVQEPIETFDSKNNKEIVRTKRQFPFGFGQSSALANANAFNQQFGPHGFGSSSALAGAQSFNSYSPFGSFGASAANSGSQGFNCGYNGCSGNAGFGASQSYNLPNGKKISLALTRGFNFSPGQQPQFSNADSFSIAR